MWCLRQSHAGASLRDEIPVQAGTLYPRWSTVPPSFTRPTFCCTPAQSAAEPPFHAPPRALRFLPSYCMDSAQMLLVVEDIDRFHLYHQSEVMKSFNGLVQEHLESREAQLLEAQSIAHIGSYVWDLETGRSTVTPELTRILGVDDDNAGFMKNIHPDDRVRVERELQAALESGSFDSEFRYAGKDGVRHLWSRGKVRYRDGKAQAMAGTIMD
ncbi:MAG: hypothetical protein EOO81_12105, partial [Oxalobacteraceae bacterium]